MSASTLNDIKQQVMRLTEKERKALADFLAGKTGGSGGDGTQGDSQSFSREMAWIRQNRESYCGKFVALKEGRLVASGSSEREVWEAANRAGVSAPFLAYIETKIEESVGGW